MRPKSPSHWGVLAKHKPNDIGATCWGGKERAQASGRWWQPHLEVQDFAHVVDRTQDRSRDRVLRRTPPEVRITFSSRARAEGTREQSKRPESPCRVHAPRIQSCCHDCVCCNQSCSVMVQYPGLSMAPSERQESGLFAWADEGLRGRAHLDTDSQQERQELGKVLKGLLMTWQGTAQGF